MAGQVSLLPVLLLALAPWHVTQHVEVNHVGAGEVCHFKLLLEAEREPFVPEHFQDPGNAGWS